MCASVQNKFWPMHEALFATQTDWETLPDPRPRFDSLAAANGRGHGGLASRASTSHLTRPLIQADHDRASARGVNSTPTSSSASADAQRRRRERARRRSTRRWRQPGKNRRPELQCASRCSLATARWRSWRAARLWSRRTASPSCCERCGRGAAFARGTRRGARRGRDPARPLLWMHAPSVGEGLQARPVLELARIRRPDAQLAYTHFSPSAASFARESRRGLPRLPAVRHAGRRARRARRAAPHGARLRQARRLAGDHARGACARRARSA